MTAAELARQINLSAGANITTPSVVLRYMRARGFGEIATRRQAREVLRDLIPHTIDRRGENR